MQTIVILGEKYSGKTSLIKRLQTGDYYIHEYHPTQEQTNTNVNIEFENIEKKFMFIEIPESKLTDIPNADLYIVMIDINSDCPDFDIKKFTSLIPNDVRKIILKNKCDTQIKDIKRHLKGRFFSVRSCYNINYLYNILENL